MTYHVHIVKINETIESISQDFKIDKDKLLELNDINTVQVGDKIIIPDLNE
ncbi:MAG: LysM peptidoglycan-binding domain-containing protein [Bacilli bacterium]|nr:LysM peptidoglycan-binding domain-containing protein [Bacilli bacterium]